MKSLNLRFCLILGITLAVVAGTVHIIHAFQVRRHADFFLEQADAALAEKDVPRAIANYDRYLKLEPNDPDAVAGLGMVLADAAADQRAFHTLEKAIRLDPSRNDVRRRLVEVTLRMNRFSDAKAHLDQLLKAAPDDAQLVGYLGRCQAADQQYLEAAASFKKAIQNDPTEIEHYLYLVALLEQRPEAFAGDTAWQTENADFWMDRLADANGASAPAQFARAQYRLGKDQFEGALADARKTLELEPQASRAMLVEAECLSKLERYDEARQAAQRALDLAPKDPQAYTTLAGIELSQKRTEEAIGWLKKGIQSVEGRSMIPVQLIQVLIDLDRNDEAAEVASTLENQEYPRPIVEFLHARIAYNQGRWQAAKDRLSGIRAEVAAAKELAPEVELWLGKTFERLGDSQEALKSYRQAISANPNYAPARAALAELLGRTGRHQESADELRNLAGVQGNTLGLQLQMTRQLLLKNLASPASQRDWAALEQALNNLKTASEDAVAISLLEAEMLIARSRSDEAEKVLLAAREKHPKEAAVWATLVEMADRRGDHEQAGKLLDEASQSAGDAVVLRLAKASHLLAAPEPAADLADQLTALAADADKFTPDQRLLLWRGLTQAALAASQPQSAEKIARMAIDAAPNDLSLNELAFRAAVQLKDAQLVASRLKAIQSIEGEGPLWHYAQALWFLQRSEKATPEDYTEARKHLAEAGKLRTDWASVSLLMATIDDQQGDAAAACQSYLHAIELGVADTQIIRRAVELLYNQEQFAQAGELLKRLEERPLPATEENDRLKSQILGRLDQFEEALEPARRVAAESKDSRDHLWLGQILAVLGFRQKAAGHEPEAADLLSQAETAMRRAQELDPAAPGPWIALIQTFVRADRREDAERVMEELAKSTAAGGSPRALADGYLLLGQQEKAAEFLEAALEKSPSDVALIRTMADFCIRTGRPQLAESGLAAIVAGKVEATPEDVTWCRRVLALALKNRGTFPDLQEALKLIDANLAADPKSLLDRRTKAILLSGHPQRAKRQQAVEILEELANSPDSNEETRLILVGLYAAEGRWERAVPHLRVMSSPQALRMYIGHLIQSDALDEAERRLRQLTQLAPDDFATFALATELRFRRGQFDEVLQDITTRHDQPAGAAETLPLTEMLNGLADRLDTSNASALAQQFREKANSLLQGIPAENAKAQASSVVLLLARSGEWRQSLDTLQKAVPDLPVPELGQVASALATQFKGNSEALAQLHSIVQSALTAHGRVVPLLQALVWVADAQGNYSDVESLYREIVKADPKNVVALNNLAEVLALTGRNPREALELIEQAIAAAGPISAFLDTRATVYRALGEPDKAVRDMQTVIVDSLKPNALVRLALAYAQQNNLPEAAKALAQARQLAFNPDQLHPLERDDYAALQKLLPTTP